MFNTQRDLEDYIQKVKFYGNNDNKQQQSRTIEIKAHKLCQRYLHDYVNFSLEGNLDGVRHLLNPTGLLLMTQEEMKSVISLLDKPYFFKAKLYLSQIANEMATEKSRGETFTPCDDDIKIASKGDIKIDDDYMAEFKSILRTALIKH